MAEIADPDVQFHPEAVLELLRDDVGRDGYQRVLDDDHVATFVQRGPKLLVTFETLDNIESVYGDAGPIGLDFVEDKNWSLLHIASRRITWFRSDALFGFFDELIDDDFFEDFEQVTFFGAGSGGYAACAYAVAAPGARVLAISPKATLNRERAGWDPASKSGQGPWITPRFGFAPDMVDGTAQTVVFYDAFRLLDYVHASLFQGPHIHRVNCRHFGAEIEAILREMDVLHQVIQMVADGTFAPLDVFQLLRRRRQHMRYHRSLLRRLARRNQPLRIAYHCKSVLDAGYGGPVIRRTLAQAKDMLTRRGALPDWLQDSADKAAE